MRTEAQLVAEHRAKNPRSRAKSIFVFDPNTASRQGKRCVLCNEEGPTWSAKWRKTKRAEEWEAEHLAKHLEGGES
jgi:hypothetical protein